MSASAGIAAGDRARSSSPCRREVNGPIAGDAPILSSPQIRHPLILLALVLPVLLIGRDASATGKANDLFQANQQVAGFTALTGTDNITQLDRLFDADVLDQITGGAYDPLTDELASAVNLRGVKARAGFLPNQSEFYFQVPAAGIDITFDAGDRDGSIAQFEDWLQGEIDAPTSPAAATTLLLQAFVALSAVEPVAGNPNSLQSRMMESAYDLTMRSAFRPAEDGELDAEGEPWTGEDVFRIRSDYTPFWADGWSGFSADLAFEYTVNLREPRMAFVFDLPVTYTQTEVQARTVMAGLGIGLLIRPQPWWNLMGQVRGGIAGSLQLGSLGVLYSTNITSNMQWSFGRTTLRIGNAVSMSSSVDGIDWFGYSLNYEITNYLLRNGFEVERALPGRLFGEPLFGRLIFNGNWVLGSEVYAPHFNEVGLAVGTTRSLGGGSTRDRTSLGVTYVGARGYDSLRVSLDVEF